MEYPSRRDTFSYRIRLTARPRDNKHLQGKREENFGLFTRIEQGIEKYTPAPLVFAVFLTVMMLAGPGVDGFGAG